MSKFRLLSRRQVAYHHRAQSRYVLDDQGPSTSWLRRKPPRYAGLEEEEQVK